MDQRVLPQSAEGGILASVYRQIGGVRSGSVAQNKNLARKSLGQDSSRDRKANTATGGRGAGRSNRPTGSYTHYVSD
ncbi:Uncharacterized protein HZ326_28943 [Fusarium oxysporum f. sp. albedinis]|nr:Uncharacterized protein HZ326_28943 [Fusarium oxysporum f. sp. albedinis]